MDTPSLRYLVGEESIRLILVARQLLFSGIRQNKTMDERENMTIAELKRGLENRGLAKDGNKPTLFARLVDYDEKNTKREVFTAANDPDGTQRQDQVYDT